MRAYQVFASLSPERTAVVMRAISEQSPGAFAQALGAACAALKARPVYLQRQPFDKRAAAIRRALARVAANDVAEEMLATYFLECRRPLLTEWLDGLGIAHEDGILQEEAPKPPPAKKLRESARSFVAKEDDPDRDLLLRAFAAQSAIDWPDLDAFFEAKT